MRTVELRHIISEQLSHIEDISFLNALKTIIDSKIAQEVYALNDYEKRRIETTRQQLKNEQTISHDELQSEVDKWLNTK